MKLRTALQAVIAASALGVLIALPLGSRRELSIDLWFVVVAIWSAKSMLSAMLRAVPARYARWTNGWRRRTQDRFDDSRRTRDVLSLEGLVIRAADNPRAHAMQLRPRLDAIADHFLPIRHGVTRERDPKRAGELLGDVAWLIEPDVDDRSPSFIEIERFLDIVLAEDGPPSQDSTR